MIRIALLAASLLLLAGCSTANTTAFNSMVTTLHNNGCHVTINVSAQAGAVNPASGVTAQGTVDCPGATSPSAVSLKAARAPEAEAPAPAPTNIAQ